MLCSVALIAAASAGLAASANVGSNSPPWDLASLKSLVVFGDSYSDDSRLNYFVTHNDSAPPVGWVDPAVSDSCHRPFSRPSLIHSQNYQSADGGRVWPEYVAQYGGAKIYNYAVSGAVCSNDITPRTLTYPALFPAIAQYELPAYLADSNYTLANGTKFIDQDPSTTAYAFWIGTNDLGNNAFLTDSQVNGTNIEDYLDCVYDQIQGVYDNGARYFVLMNVVPLNLAPLYALPANGGVGANHYWPQKPSNLTEISYRMMEQVVGVNAVYKYRTPFAAQVARRYPGAKFAVFDVHGLVSNELGYEAYH